MVTLACRDQVLLLSLPFINQSRKAREMGWPTQVFKVSFLCEALKQFCEWRHHSCLLWISDSFLCRICRNSSLAIQESMYEERQPKRKTEWRPCAGGINTRCKRLNK